MKTVYIERTKNRYMYLILIHPKSKQILAPIINFRVYLNW